MATRRRFGGRVRLPCARPAAGAGGQHAAEITLLLTSDPTADPTSAMATNLSLLHTRAVSEEVVDGLDLPLTPGGLPGDGDGRTAVRPAGGGHGQGPSDQEAIRRVNALASVYLAFRGQQLSTFADSTIQANQRHIDSLDTEIAALSKRYDAAASTPGQEQLATALLTQRAQLQRRSTLPIRRTRRPASRARRSPMPATSSTPLPSSTSPGSRVPCWPSSPGSSVGRRSG